MKHLLITIVLFFEVPLSQEDTEYGMNWSEILSKDYEMEKPKKDFYLSCFDEKGWFGGKSLSSIFYYDKKNEKLTENRFNKSLEKIIQPAIETKILSEIEHPLHSSTEDIYVFGKTVPLGEGSIIKRSLTKFSGVILNRENLEMTYERGSKYCEINNQKDHEKILKGFRDRSEKFELKKNEYHKNKNQL